VTIRILYDYSSYSLELLGERQLMLGMYLEGAAIFQLAVNEFPTYTYGYLYMGRAYEESGKQKDAIQAYQKIVTKDKKIKTWNRRSFSTKAFERKGLKHERTTKALCNTGDSICT
jgi:tetratricopeptide (TPR) repeat protein